MEHKLSRSIDQMKDLGEKVAKASQTPNNSVHAHQISRDFGMVMGILSILEENWVMVEDMLYDIEKTYE